MFYSILSLLYCTYSVSVDDAVVVETSVCFCSHDAVVWIAGIVIDHDGV